MFLDIDTIKKISRNIEDDINLSREQILNIVENIKSSHLNIINQLNKIKCDALRINYEFDELQKQEKDMDKLLSEVLANMNKFTEDEIKLAYEKVLGIKIRINTKKNEEKMLREHRYNLEVELKKIITNIENGEKSLNQIKKVGVSFGYLKEDIFLSLGGVDNNTKMLIGIKILEAEENERIRILRNVNDGPAKQLGNIIEKVNNCTGFIQKDSEEGIKTLEDLKESVRAAIKEVRSIIFDLRPMQLVDLELNQTILEIVNTISEESNINVDINLKPSKTEIEPIIQVAVYRIIQEVFNNIRKHSKAKQAKIKLDVGDKYLMLIISDDGIGFEVEDTLKKARKEGESYGLINIIDRIEQLQGDIKMESSVGAGTIYSIRLPISRKVIRDEKLYE